MKKAKKVVSGVLAALALAGLAGCGGSGTGAAGAGTASADTALGGKVVIYTSMYEDIVEMIDNKLEEVFPTVDVEFFYGGTGTLQSKVAAEIDAGSMGCDILMAAEPAWSLELKEQNLLHAYDYAEKDKLMFEYDPEGYWYPVRMLDMVLAYNPEKYDKAELPASFKDFAADSSLKGYCSMGNPLTSGTSYAAIVALQDKYGDDYFRQLGEQNIAIESGSVALTKLETGECKEIMILQESVLKKREEENSSLEVIYPDDGSIMVPSTIMVVAEDRSANKNIAACEAIEEWFLSAEGQEYIVKGWMHSVRSDFTAEPYDSIPTAEIAANTIPVDWERCYREREAIRTLFQEYVTVG